MAASLLSGSAARSVQVQKQGVTEEGARAEAGLELVNSVGCPYRAPASL